MLKFYTVTVLLCYSIIQLQYYDVTVLPCYSITQLQYENVTVLHSYSIKMLQYYTVKTVGEDWRSTENCSVDRILQGSEGHS